MFSGLKVVLLGTLLGTLVALIISYPSKSTITRKGISVQQFQNIRAGDFVFSETYTGSWCPVRQVGNGWVTVRAYSEIITLTHRDVDSINFALRNMDGNEWQQMAIKYCTTH